MNRSEARAEVVLALVAIALALLFLVEGAKLKPGVFEPIGPGAVPMGVAVATIVLAVLVLAGRWRRRDGAARGAGDPADAPPADDSALSASDPDGAGLAERENWRLMLAASVLTLVYAGVLHTGVARYGWVTVAYLLVTFLVVSDRVRKDAPWAVALALVFGLGLDYVFRHLLVADLP